MDPLTLSQRPPDLTRFRDPQIPGHTQALDIPRYPRTVALIPPVVIRVTPVQVRVIPVQAVVIPVQVPVIRVTVQPIPVLVPAIRIRVPVTRAPVLVTRVLVQAIPHFPAVIPVHLIRTVHRRNLMDLIRI